jgi:ATP-dependent helicase/DNAse subunit B
LLEHQLFDDEGRFWVARNWLNQGQRRPFENLQLVVVDGFSDFTRTQHEILEILAGRVDAVFISLTLESKPCRADLFAKPLKTLAELQRRHPGLKLRELERRSSKTRLAATHRGASEGALQNEFSDALPDGSRLNEVGLNEESLNDVQNVPCPSPVSWPAMAHLERWLFGNPRQLQAAETTEGIEILAAARPIGEMEMVAARVKWLIVEEGVKPGEIAVVFRSPQDPGSLAAEVFERLGLPVAWEQGLRLDRVPILRALVAMLKLDLDDWPFNSLLAVIGGNYFNPPWPEWQKNDAAVDLERTIRQRQIPQGRATLLQELNRKFRPVKNGELPDVLPDGSLLNDDGLNDIDHSSSLFKLAAAFDELPQKATLPDWAKAWEKLARQTGMLNTISGEIENDIQRADAAAWNLLMSILSSGDRLAGWLKQHPPELNREEAVRALLDILGSERLPIAEEESGRVRVLSASSVRSLHLPYLFLAGLSEKAFPQPDREDRLYSEAEYLRLIEQNLPLVARSERNREEMLLFYEAVTRATKRLYLSYPALDDSAQPLSPSPFLLEVEQACGKDKIAKTEATDFRPVPKTTQPLSPAEFRIAAMAEALEGNYHWLAGMRQFAMPSSPASLPKGEGSVSAAQNLFAGLELTMLRQDRDRFGAAEGLLSSPEVRKLLRTEFSSSRTFSVTELEAYARCPYRYLLEKVLKVEPLEDIALETDYMERGQTVHEVLAAFHRRVNETLGGPGSPAKLDAEQFEQLMQAAMEEGLPPSLGNPVRAALREIDRRLVVKWLADYRRQHEAYDSLWTECQSPPAPEFFEISFGKSKHPSTTWHIEAPFEIADDKETIRLSGRIDRVDTGKAGGKVIFNILDYKTGYSAKFSLDEFMHGTALQLPVYALAVAEIFLNDRDALPWRAGYWYVAKDGFKNVQALKMYRHGEDELELEEEWETVRDEVAGIVTGLVHGMRGGYFPVFNRNLRCASSCPFGTICRINQIRSLEKTCLPTVIGEKPVTAIAK